MDCNSDLFFTEAAFERYAVQPTLQELLEKYAPINTPPSGTDKKTKVDKRSENANQKRKEPYSGLECSARPEFRYPRYSSLMLSEHKKYLKLEAKYSQHSLQGKHTTQELHELREFRQYQTQINNEQREFQRHAEIVAKRCVDDYAYLHPLAQVYIKRLLSKWCERLRAQPHNYALYQTIGMGVEPVTPSDPVLKHMGCLITLGETTPMALQALDPHKPPVLHHLVSVKDGANKEPKEDDIPIVSEDENAKKLAAKYNANIVISYVAMETLLDNHPPPVNFDQQWEIPITVSCHGEEGNGQSTPVKTIYIDNPLKQKVIFPHEANAVFHKGALKQMLSIDCKSPITVDSSDNIVENYLQGGVDFSSSAPSEGKLESLTFGAVSDADALMDLETFGSGIMFPLPKRIKQCEDKSSLESYPEELSGLANKALLYAHQTRGKCTQDAASSVEVTAKAQSIQVDTPETRDSPLSPGLDTVTNPNERDGTKISKETFQTDDNPCLETEAENIIKGDACLSSKPYEVDDIQESPASPDPYISYMAVQSPTDTQCQGKQSLSSSPNNPFSEGKLPHTGDASLSSKETQDDATRGSPLSPDQNPISKDSQNDAIRDSPLSPDQNHDSEETQNYGIRDSPLSPDQNPASKDSQDDTIRDSPLSPDQNHDSEETQNYGIRDSPLSPDQNPASKDSQDDTIRDSPLSPDQNHDSKETQADAIIDSPLSPDLNHASSIASLDHRETQADAVSDSPSSPDPKSAFNNVTITHENDVRQIVTGEKGVQSLATSVAEPTTSTTHSIIKSSILRDKSKAHTVKQVMIQENKEQLESAFNGDPYKSNVSLMYNNSSSENEGDLVIASGFDTDSDNLRIVSDNSPVSKANTATSSAGNRSKPLDALMNSEDDSDGMVTRRRSARLRKADESEQHSSPVKRQKKLDTVEASCKNLAGTVVDAKKADTGSCIEKTLSCMEDSGVKDAKEDTVSNNPSPLESMETQPSLISETALDSGKPVALKRTSPSASDGKIKSNPILKKTRTKNISKTQPQRGTKAGPMSSTIDTIMKLQEALHTRRRQRGPSEPMQGRNMESKVDQNQQLNVIQENPADYQAPKDGNVSYRLWKLGKINILIRTRDDGVLVDNNQQKFPVTVLPKMEYQAHFGYEQEGVQELCRIWANLFARPGSKVVRGRINALTSELLKMECLDLSSPLWVNYPVNPARSMKMMHTMFDKLQGLPEGKYLLSHNPGDTHASVHLALEQGTKKRVTYNLHAAHPATPLESGPPATLPWLPLDPKQPLCKHLKEGTIPMTFPPLPTGMKNRPHGPAPKKKKKNKGKKKKPNSNFYT